MYTRKEGIYLCIGCTLLFFILLILLAYLHRKREGFEIDTDYSNSFCKQYQGKSDELEKACGRLTSKNCSSSPCCVFKNNESCVAGSQNGPTFKTDTDGKQIAIHQYIFQNTCYGKDCNNKN